VQKYRSGWNKKIKDFHVCTLLILIILSAYILFLNSKQFYIQGKWKINNVTYVFLLVYVWNIDISFWIRIAPQKSLPEMEHKISRNLRITYNLFCLSKGYVQLYL
jgi:hypothetical protein